MSTYISHDRVALVGVVIVLSSPLRADIKNWQTGETILGTEGITPGPDMDLSRRHRNSRNLRYADFLGGLQLSSSLFYDSWIENARFTQANLAGASFIFATLTNVDLSQTNLSGAVLNTAMLTNADLSDAVVNGASFVDTTARGFTKEQLYSTASYQQRNLQRIRLGGNDLGGWDFTGQDLTRAVLDESNLTGADLTDAMVGGASFHDTTSLGFSKEQLYATASYQERNLQRIGLDHNDLRGWDFAGQDLTNADLAHARLTNANLTGAVIRGARLCDIPGFAKEQLYSTASYQERNLQGVGLYENNMSGWNFAGQDLTNAILCCSILTNANFTGANLKGADFTFTESLLSADFSPQTLYNQWTKFPVDFDPQAQGLTFVASPAGDFDANDVLDAADIDLLARRIRDENVLFWQLIMFDLDMSSAIDAEDHRIWIHEVKKTRFGDTNLDGLFNNVDLVTILQAGEYEDGLYRNSSWATGDWNGDGEFDRADVVLALQDGGYAQGPRVALAAVPEPASLVLVLLGMVIGGGFCWARPEKLSRGTHVRRRPFLEKPEAE